MQKFIPIFEFIVKERPFWFLFTLFTATYFCLFLALIFRSPTEFSEFTLHHRAVLGILLSLLGGLMASLAWKLVTWRARQSLEIQKEKIK